MSSTAPFIKLGKKAQDGIVEFGQSCHDLFKQHWNIRDQMREIDLAYMREQDLTKKQWDARIANKYGDSTKIQNYTVPVVKPHVETAVEYQVGVFLSHAPLFGCVGSRQYADAAFQMETILDNQSIRGGWAGELELFFRDCFKYNLGVIEIDWHREVTAAIETDFQYSRTQGRPVNVTWEGNRVRRRDPYNIIFDTRVDPVDMCWKGEFAGYVELMSRVALKDFVNKLPDKIVGNLQCAYESGVPNFNNYYVPVLNFNALMSRNIRATTDWMAWATASETQPKIQYSDQYEVKTLYGRIIPSDFGLSVPSANTPQVWKFIFVNDEHLIYAERQTNAHGLIPMLFGQPNEDGLAYQTKSTASEAMPTQAVTSALMNSVLEARRRAISDRTLFDPSRIREADINSQNPSAKIPVRPSAYGKPLSEAVYPFPFRDDNSVLIMQEIPAFINFANQANGQNQARQGQFVKGNKTQGQWDDTMTNATSRDQSIALKLEARVFTPLKEILKINVLQFQGGTTLTNRQKQTEVTVDPIVLRKAILQFKVTDGVTTASKTLHGDVLQTGLQILGSSQQIASEYEVGPLFSYLIQTQGANIREFEKPAQIKQYEQAVAAWQQTVLAMQKQNKEITAAQLPPQPKPADYGIGQDGRPQEPAGKEEEQPTLIEQVMAIQNGGTAPDPDGDAAQDVANVVQ